MVTYPKDWDYQSLGKCCIDKLSYGINAPAIPHSSQYPSYLRITDINDDGTYNSSEKKSVVTNETEKYSLRSGDIVLARTGASTGKSYLYDERDGNFVYAGFLIKASVDEKRHNAKYIVSQLRTPRYWSWVASESMRSGQPGINGKQYSSFLIPVASKEEQDDIAETLSCIDTHIANLTELIEKKKAIRDGALEDLVSGRTRLDGFSSEWKDTNIGSITSEIITGGTPSTTISSYWGGTIPWLASTEIHQKRITRPTTFITESGIRYSAAKIAPKDSVLIALAGQGKTRGTAAFLVQDMAINQSLAALVVNEKADANFLFYAMERSYLRLRELSSGDGGRGGLNKKLLKQFTIPFTLDTFEQKAIADILITIDNEIVSLEEEKDKMLQIKAGAMDDLLTGRVRLMGQGG